MLNTHTHTNAALGQEWRGEGGAAASEKVQTVSLFRPKL